MTDDTSMFYHFSDSETSVEGKMIEELADPKAV